MMNWWPICLPRLQSRKVDFTLFFRRLADLGNVHGEALPEDLMALFHGPAESFHAWIGAIAGRLRAENSDAAERKVRMNAANPLYVLRNYLLEQAIALAKNGRFPRNRPPAPLPAKPV